jgi:hypothetical protein
MHCASKCSHCKRRQQLVVLLLAPQAQTFLQQLVLLQE